MARETKLVVCCGGCEPKCGKCGEVQWVEMTDEEIAQMEADAAAYAEQKAAADAEAAAKAAAKASALEKLAALGLTSEEAQAIAGA